MDQRDTASQVEENQWEIVTEMVDTVTRNTSAVQLKHSTAKQESLSAV